MNPNLNNLENILQIKTGYTKKEYLYKLEKAGQKRITEIDVLVSGTCDQDCLHCYIPKNIKNKQFNKNEVTNLIKLLKTNKYLVLPQYTEIFLNNNTLNFFKDCKDDNIITNGNYLSKLNNNELKQELNSLKIKKIFISLHIDEKNHNDLTNNNNWSSTIKLIKKLNNLKYYTGVYAVFTKKSYRNIPSFAKFLINNKIKEVTFIQCLTTTEKTKNLKLNNNEFKDACKLIAHLKEEIPKNKLIIKTRGPTGPNFFSSSLYNLQLNKIKSNNFTCRGGKGYCGAGESFFVAVKEKDNLYNIYPCHMLIRKELIVGNINLVTNKIKFNPNVIQLIAPYKSKQDGVCKKCYAWDYCKGGCLANNYLNKTNNTYHTRYCYTKSVLK